MKWNEILKRGEYSPEEPDKLAIQFTKLLKNKHTKRSSKHGKGTKMEEDTFVQENGPEKGIIHHFVDENEIHQLLKGFKILKLQLEEHETEGYLRSHLAVMATKD